MLARLRLFVLVPVTLICAIGCRSTAWPGSDSLAEFDRQIIGEVLTHSDFSSNLRSLCMPGGRLSGSENADKASEYVAEQLRAYGLSNVHLEPFTMTTWRDRKTTVTLLDDQPIVLVGAIALGNSLSTPPEGVTAEVVDVGKGTDEDFAAHADEISGKFVMARRGGGHRGHKMALALEHEAVGLLHVSSEPDSVHVGTCHDRPKPNPGVAITGDQCKLISERLERGETVRINVKIEADAWESTPNNVVGEIPGHGPLAHEVIVMCGHLDSWHLAEGAIDNGNGSATILETARALAALNYKPERTLRFIWFMGEEHGLFGSKAYAKQHVGEFDDIVAVINVDMPGIPKRFATFDHPEIVEFLEDLQCNYLRGFELNNDVANATWTASDHAPFMAQGVCCLTLYGDIGSGGKYYHTTGDKYEVVDRPGTTLSSAVLGVLMHHLAEAPDRPTRRFDPDELDIRIGW